MINKMLKPKTEIFCVNVFFINIPHLKAIYKPVMVPNNFHVFLLILIFLMIKYIYFLFKVK